MTNAPAYLVHGYRQVAKNPKTGAINADGLTGQFLCHVNCHPLTLKGLITFQSLWFSRAHGAL